MVRFIFGFVIPVVRAGLNMRKKMREMQNHMNGFGPTQQQPNNSHNGNTTAHKSDTKASSSDYIDFEEIK